jgi:crotonobetainyl-CoA:carnitine CoA-transferase CaiB-like acyl-CoA transferase
MTAVPPLAGLRVLELARVLAGPWVGQTLADLGADVVKVERPGSGDDTRAWGPPFVFGPEGENLSAAYFHAANRGKRSIALDFEKAGDLATVRRLASRADVLIENFKVGGLARYGLDYASLAALNPRLVYCSITGFGQTGPYAGRAGYDFVSQAMGGIMSLTGEPDGEPQKAAIAVSDIIAGLYGVIGVQAALARRAVTGLGGHVDMALLDATVGVLANHAMAFLSSGEAPVRYGNAHPTIVPYQVFPVADGHVALAVGNDGQFAKLCHVLGAPELASNENYRTNALRIAHRESLIAAIGALTGGFTRKALLEALDSEQVPVGPINTLAEVFSDPQVVHRRMRVDLPRVQGGSVPSVRGAIVLDGEPVIALRVSPELGEHGPEILADPAWGGAPDGR